MKFEIIPTKAILYDKCENVEQLYDNFYYPLLVEYKELKKKYENAKNQLQQKENIIKEVREYIENKEFINYKKNLGNFERMLKHRQDISKIKRK